MFHHPALARAAALKARFYAHALRPDFAIELPAIIVAEIETLSAHEDDAQYRDELETEAMELRAEIASIEADLDNYEIYLTQDQIEALQHQKINAIIELEEVATILESFDSNSQ